MKRINRVLLILLSFMMILSYSVYAATSNYGIIETNVNLSGVLYDGELKPVECSSDLDSSLQIDSIIINGQYIAISATTIYNEQEITINSNGKIYKSVISDDAVVGLFNENDYFTITSFVIEFEPQSDLLLNTTKDRIVRGNNAYPILKIAVTINSTGDVLYFEDMLYNTPQSFVFK